MAALPEAPDKRMLRIALDDSETFEELRPILQAVAPIDDLREFARIHIENLDNDAARRAAMSALSIFDILSDDVMQHTLSFCHSRDLRAVCTRTRDLFELNQLKVEAKAREIRAEVCDDFASASPPSTNTVRIVGVDDWTSQQRREVLKDVVSKFGSEVCDVDELSLDSAISNAESGDTIVIVPGQYSAKKQWRLVIKWLNIVALKGPNTVYVELKQCASPRHCPRVPIHRKGIRWDSIVFVSGIETMNQKFGKLYFTRCTFQGTLPLRMNYHYPGNVSEFLGDEAYPGVLAMTDCTFRNIPGNALELVSGTARLLRCTFDNIRGTALKFYPDDRLKLLWQFEPQVRIVGCAFTQTADVVEEEDEEFIAHAVDQGLMKFRNTVLKNGNGNAHIVMQYNEITI